jgi:hypothetical protein
MSNIDNIVYQLGKLNQNSHISYIKGGSKPNVNSTMATFKHLLKNEQNYIAQISYFKGGNSQLNEELNSNDQLNSNEELISVDKLSVIINNMISMRKGIIEQLKELKLDMKRTLIDFQKERETLVLQIKVISTESPELNEKTNKIGELNKTINDIENHIVYFTTNIAQRLNVDEQIVQLQNDIIKFNNKSNDKSNDKSSLLNRFKKLLQLGGGTNDNQYNDEYYKYKIDKYKYKISRIK